jgi:hypothetical protein
VTSHLKRHGKRWFWKRERKAARRFARSEGETSELHHRAHGTRALYVNGFDIEDTATFVLTFVDESSCDFEEE